MEKQEILSNSINEKIKQLLPAKEILQSLLNDFESNNLQNQGNYQARMAYEQIWSSFKNIERLQAFELSQFVDIA